MDEILTPADLPLNHRSGFIALVGRPNVGKSTLLNAYVGQKVAIVSKKPQTTRNRILGILTRPDSQIVFVDTPGIHRPSHKLGEYMVKAAREAVPDADEVLLVVDVSVLPTPEDRLVAELLAQRCVSPVIMALNKMDLLPPEGVGRNVEAYLALVKSQGWMLTSATLGGNLDKLLEMVTAHLPSGPRYYPENQVTDLTERFVTSELVREQVLRFLHQEVPHAIAVVVEEFKQRPTGVTYIDATIFVEKESQKAIVIGSAGSMLKRIGTAARHEMEQALATKVYLELRVKVRSRWRRDDVALRHVGYPS